jgi:predicted metal-dependent hydrolase
LAQSLHLFEGDFILNETVRYARVKSELPGEGIIFDGRFVVSKSSMRQISALLKDWYMGQANELLIPRIKHYAKQIGVDYRRVLILDLKYRWGSCTPKNNLNFNWRLIKAPMSVIEYVIVHELAHLLEHNHGTRFWTIVKTQAPQYERAKEWLKKNGQVLD